MKKNLKVPKFKNRDEEFEYWSNLNLDEYFEPNDFTPVEFPNLKSGSSSTKIISISSKLLERVRQKAKQLNVPSRSLIEEYIERGISSSR